MADAAVLAFNFALGVAAFFSPCGFPMLPAYVAYYLGRDLPSPSPSRSPSPPSLASRLARGALGGALAAAGAFAVLATVGALAAALGTPFKERVLLIELVGGLLVMGLGVATLFGKDFSFTPAVTASRRRGLLGLAAFGALYAAVAAGCVAPVFISVVFQAVAAPTFADGFLYVAAYAAGLGLLLVAVTVAVSLAGVALVRRLNVLLPYVKKVGGVVMILVGLYLVWYWYRIEFLL